LVTALPTNIREGKRGLPGTNSLAYLASVSEEEKSLIMFTPGVNVIKLFVRDLRICVIS
jgi:hypothetical protein